MNIKEAIEIIECFFRESDNKCANGECDFASPMCQYDREAAFEIALSALREKAERENPKPLTLEELKERVEKPVYIMWRPDENWRFAESGWVVVELDGEFIDGYSFKNYGQTWLAYDHEPKEAII